MKISHLISLRRVCQNGNLLYSLQVIFFGFIMEHKKPKNEQSGKHYQQIIC
jgi:hypothetical protein